MHPERSEGPLLDGLRGSFASLGTARVVMTSPTNNPPLLEVKNLRVEFPTRRGTLLAVDDVSFEISPGEVLGRGGRVGRGQVADRQRHHRPARAAGPDRGRRDPPRRTAHRQSALRGDAQGARRAHRRDLPGPADQPEPALFGRPPAGRDDPDPPAAQRRRRAPARARAPEGGRHPGRRAAHRPLPAPVLRRHAPAGGDRAGPVRRPAPDRGRRADHGARRVDPGADHRAAEAAVPRARHGGDAGHPRHGRDRRDRRPGRGDVCRPHRRDRPGARRHQERAASLHQGPDGLDPASRRARREADPDRRLDAAPHRDPERLRLQSALHLPRPALPGRAAGADGRRARAAPPAGCTTPGSGRSGREDADLVGKEVVDA